MPACHVMSCLSSHSVQPACVLKGVRKLGWGWGGKVCGRSRQAGGEGAGQVWGKVVGWGLGVVGEGCR